MSEIEESQDAEPSSQTTAKSELMPGTDESGRPSDSEATKLRQAMRKIAAGSPDTMIEMTAMMGMVGNPIHQKMNAEHITKLLDLSIQHDTNEYNLLKDRQKSENTQEHVQRVFHLIYFVVFVALVVFIIWIFQKEPTLLVPILSGLGGAVTGFMGGVGYANLKKGKGDNAE